MMHSWVKIWGLHSSKDLGLWACWDSSQPRTTNTQILQLVLHHILLSKGVIGLKLLTSVCSIWWVQCWRRQSLGSIKQAHLYSGGLGPWYSLFYNLVSIVLPYTIPSANSWDALKPLVNTHNTNWYELWNEPSDNIELQIFFKAALTKIFKD